ncbi:uncharacterized protein LOC143034397 isoform X4 [Oratosquilla oratoria]|uniref:uncharacterized protein LOC143034397 isoform X4 n=1 Tax=Oratosquilla oratoria TaxID=337810 RepID=UPI003F75891A
MGSVGGVGGDEKESVKNGEDRCCGSGEGGKDAEGEKERIGNVNCNERKREDGLNSRFGDLHSSKEKNNEIKEDSSSSSQMLSLLDEFTKIYAQRLDRVEQTSKGNNDTKYLQEKVSVLQSWVRDLGDQNAVLVATVEELEREAGDRVALLEDKLASMATVTRESCVSIRDHHLQVHAAVQDAEKDTQSLRAGVSELEQSNKRLCQDNKNLQQDISSLIQVISRARHTGDWDMDDVTFSCISPEQLFGPCIPISSSRRSSLRDGRRDFGRDYLHQLLEEHIRKDSSTIRSSLSNLQDVEKSLYGGKVTEKDLAIVKLRADLRCLQNAHEEANVLLMDRDKQIADLQAQVTDAQHELEVAQAERNEMNRQLQHLRNQTRNDNVEISRKDELIRQLRQQSPTKKDLYSPSSSSPLEHDNSKGEVEAQLSANIDLLTWRLTQLETESTELQQKYQALQATHSLCKHPTSPLHSQDSRDFSMVEAGTMTDNDISEDAKLRRLHNEVAEKAVLLRELQGHLSSSRQELSLKDETLSRVEAKLDSCRRDGGQREERLQQLTGQLTRLQLQVATTHGQAEQLRRQVEVKTEQIIKQEAEITSLSLKLKDEQVRRTCTEEENRRISDQLCGKEKEIADQKVTISGLQDALVKSKQACDELRVRLDADGYDMCLDIFNLHAELEDSCARIKQLEQDLAHAQQLHHQTFTQLITSGERMDSLRQENISLGTRVDQLSAENHRLRAHAKDGHVAIGSAESSWQQRLDEATTQHKKDKEMMTSELEYERQMSATMRTQVEGLVEELAAKEEESRKHQQALRTTQRKLELTQQQINLVESRAQASETETRALTESLASQKRTAARELAKKEQQLHEALSSSKQASIEAQVTRTRLEAQLHKLEDNLESTKAELQLAKRRAEQLTTDHEHQLSHVTQRGLRAHEAAVRRLEALLHCSIYTQTATDEMCGEEVESRLTEVRLALEEVTKERDALARTLALEQARLNGIHEEQSNKVHRLLEENQLLKSRLDGVQAEVKTWRRQCEDLEERGRQARDAITADFDVTSVQKLQAHVTMLNEEKAQLQEQLSKMAEKVADMTSQLFKAEERQHHLQQSNEMKWLSRSYQLQCRRTFDLAYAPHLSSQHLLHQQNGELNAAKQELEKERQKQEQALAEVRREASETQKQLVEAQCEAKRAKLNIAALERELESREKEWRLGAQGCVNHSLGLFLPYHQPQFQLVNNLERQVAAERSANQDLTSQSLRLRNKVQELEQSLGARRIFEEDLYKGKVDRFEDEMVKLKGELAVKEEELHQAKARYHRLEQLNADQQLEITRLTAARDAAVMQEDNEEKKLHMEAAVGAAVSEAVGAVDVAQAAEQVWENQLVAIREQTAQLACEGNQLKQCNIQLHEQLSATEREVAQLQAQLHEQNLQLEETRQTRDLLANDSQVVVSAVKQWLHEQKAANQKLAGKLHQQNKHILLLNTEKQFLAERNTSLQRTCQDLNHELQELRGRLGLPGNASPRVVDLGCGGGNGGLSDLGGRQSSLDSFLSLAALVEDRAAAEQEQAALSTCSSDACSVVPGIELPHFDLDRIGVLADSLLASAKNKTTGLGLDPVTSSTSESRHHQQQSSFMASTSTPLSPFLFSSHPHHHHHHPDVGVVGPHSLPSRPYSTSQPSSLVTSPSSLQLTSPSWTTKENFYERSPFKVTSPTQVYHKFLSNSPVKSPTVASQRPHGGAASLGAPQVTSPVRSRHHLFLNLFGGSSRHDAATSGEGAAPTRDYAHNLGYLTKDVGVGERKEGEKEEEKGSESGSKKSTGGTRESSGRPNGSDKGPGNIGETAGRSKEEWVGGEGRGGKGEETGGGGGGGGLSQEKNVPFSPIPRARSRSFSLPKESVDRPL